ncbi:MAG: type II secretion system protein [Agitococcus sp.]|nr:type II secretion system protein [Agitococcus sp.]MDO9179221.1 type II secretion system protein [Agitococcus sp.]
MRYSCTTQRTNSGVTMVELLFTVFLLGIISITMSASFRSFLTAKDQSYQERQLLINNKIAAAMLEYASTSSMGVLPTPYSNAASSIYFGLANPTSFVGFGSNLLQQGLSLREVNDDGTAGAHVRVYQRVANNLLTVPMYFQSGATVDLYYDQGVIYMTDCLRSLQTACNGASASTSNPPKGNKLTSGTLASWTPGAADTAIVGVSSLSMQKQMLEKTTARLDKLREAMSAFVKAKQAFAGPGDTTNFYPAPSDTSYWVGVTNQDPATNQGCRDGWYQLDASPSTRFDVPSGKTVSTMDVLPQIGLSPDELARTAWAATIEYCRKYDPAGSGVGPGTAPHSAALRINRVVSFGLLPDSFVPANNVVLSF